TSYRSAPTRSSTGTAPMTVGLKWTTSRPRRTRRAPRNWRAGKRPPRPPPGNPYGASNLAGRDAAAAAYGAQPTRLAIVRTGWLYGMPGDDFPEKILAAAERASLAGQPLKVVGDEYGSPTFAQDVAETISDLLGSGDMGGIHHIVNAGVASRADWPSEVFRHLGLVVEIEEVPASTWERASTPPRWGVLEPTPTVSGEPMRSWQTALADHVTALRLPRAGTCW